MYERRRTDRAASSLSVVASGSSIEVRLTENDFRRRRNVKNNVVVGGGEKIGRRSRTCREGEGRLGFGLGVCHYSRIERTKDHQVGKGVEWGI
jgi:hypothetical protein